MSGPGRSRAGQRPAAWIPTVGHGRRGPARPDDRARPPSSSASASGCWRSARTTAPPRSAPDVEARRLPLAGRPAGLRGRLRRGDLRPRARTRRAPGRAGAGRGRCCGPAPAALRFAQDKLAMRERLTELGMPCPRLRAGQRPGRACSSSRDQAGWPVVLKAVSGGYDGKGVWVCETPAEAAERAGARACRCWPRSSCRSSGSWPRWWRGRRTGQGAAYPVVQTVQRDGICREVIAPAPGLSEGRAAQAQRIGAADRERAGA